MPLPKIPLCVIRLKDVSIFDQLKLEEYLLRDTNHNYCLLNAGSNQNIVMGISGKVEELVHIDKAQDLKIPVIKRFSGGGTVVVDEDTLFATLIFNSVDVKVPCFPEPIYKFTESMYKVVFEGLPFELKQNDYIMDNKKFGGNAQYLKKDRFLHHTSFLWDYKPHLMGLLKHPKKTPEYRQNRAHEDFVCKLQDYVSTKEDFFLKLLETLDKSYEINFLSIEDLQKEASRTSTVYLDLTKHDS